MKELIQQFMENLVVHLDHLWIWFSICLVIIIATATLMARQTKHFKYLRGTAITPFNIIDLELPGSESSIAKILLGIDALKNETGAKSLTALRNNLRTDFVYMLGIYPAIFLLCMHVALKMQTYGRWLLLILAWAQVVAFLFDIAENIYLLRKMRHPAIASEQGHKWYKRMVSAKWTIAVVGGICALSCMLYFWIHGSYSNSFFIAGLVLLVLIGIMLIITLYRTVHAIFDNDADAVQSTIPEVRNAA